MIPAIWVNIDTRWHTKSLKSQNIAVGPQDPPHEITRIRYPMSQRVKRHKSHILVKVVAAKLIATWDGGGIEGKKT